MFALAPRRLIALILLLGFGAAFASPALAVQAAHSAKMSCCKRGKGACCKRHHKSSESMWTAVNSCPRQCSLVSPAPQVGGFALPSPVALGFEERRESPILPLEEARRHSGAYLAFLYQIPPPSPAL